MISIYNGRKRSLGTNSKREVYLEIYVGLRRYLNLFKGASLGVFMSIALHSDEHGWAWPTVPTIMKESGYEDDTVHRALSILCGGTVKGKKLLPLTIKGRRVMLRTKAAPTHYKPNPEDGKYARNFYLIFPTDEDIARYETEETTSEKSDTVFSDTDFSDTEKSDTVFSGIKNSLQNSPSKPEETPSLKETPHTHQETPALFEHEEKERVCVSDALTFSDYLSYARSHSSFTTPEAWASVHFDRRDRDELVREWLEGQKPEAIAEARAAQTDNRLTYHEALQRVVSMPAPTLDHRRSYIASLDVSDEVRALLIEKFCREKAAS